MTNGNKNLYNLASRCVFKNYNSIKNIADVNGEFGNHVLDDENPHNVNKIQIGLGNVNNTADANKPVSTAQATAIGLKVTANPAITGGTSTKITYDSNGLVISGTTLLARDVPSLDASKITSGRIDPARLPSYFDDIFDCANPSNIVQNSNYRFTTDTEKSTWNNKQDAITGTTDTITVITSVDFDAKTTTSKTITITNGIVTNII